MKRFYQWVLAATLTCGMMTLASCQGLVDAVFGEDAQPAESSKPSTDPKKPTTVPTGIEIKWDGTVLEIKEDTKIELTEGDKVNLTATLLPEGVEGEVTVSATPEDILSIDIEKGTVEALKAGTATVNAKYTNGDKEISVEFEVEVKAAEVKVTSITLNKTTTEIKVDATETLSVTAVAPDDATVKTYTWKSSDETMATVDQDGKVTGVATGTVTISAEANDGSGVKGECKVTVTEAAWAANEYNEASWDGTKVVFTKQTAASVTAVKDATANVTWGDGYYTVSGNVTITGNVTLTADVHLILQDGAKLTINGQLDCSTNNKNLYIYGQDEGNGKLIVQKPNDGSIEPAIYVRTDKKIEIHGGEITAAATGNSQTGLYTGYIEVYGGKLTATSGEFHGISFRNTFDVYGGEVVATSNSTSEETPCFGIVSGAGQETQILTVYGGKVTATGNGKGSYGSGISCYVKSGTSGINFYFADTEAGLATATAYPCASATDTTSAAAYKKQFAKAE